MSDKKDYSELLNKFDDNFYEARKRLLHDDPFYAQMLYQCAIEMNDKVGTISIKENDGTIYIIYSEKWVNSIEPEKVVEAIKHVLTHLIFGHLTSELFKNKEEDKKMDVAEDLAINTTLKKDNLPEGFLKPEDFQLSEDKSTYDYYNQLPDMKNRGKGKGKGKGQGEGQGDGKPQDGDSDNEEDKTGDNHHFMTSTVSQSQLENQTKAMVQQAYKRAGNRMPSNHGSGIRKLMNFLLQPSELPWNMILRNFVSFSSKVKREPTWKRPNRRFGEELQGKRKVQTLHIFVAIDESGSIADEEWKQFMSEIDDIHRTKLASITICKFTSKVEKVFEFKNIEEVSKDRYYGGTCFQPFLDTAESLRPDCLICLTDGYNSEFDDLKYTRFGTVLWCLTPNGRKNKNGKNLIIKKINKEEAIFW